jgi:hypothetical protein
MKDRIPVATPNVDDLTDFIREKGIVYANIDPFVKTHDFDENNNSAIDFAARQFCHVAYHSNCAIDLIHHTRKDENPEAHAGDISAARGASALAGAVRGGYTLATMSEQSAAASGIKPEERTRLVRVDDAKANNALIGHEPRWFYRQTVILPNGDEDTPGDAVGVLRPFDMTALHEERRKQQEAAQEPERQNIAEIVGRAIGGTESALTAIVPVICDALRCKDRTARDRILSAIPTAPAYREVYPVRRPHVVRATA